MKFKTEEQRKITYRRLLLSKQLYLHGLSHSHIEGELNKMIAVHNFHNAIEITLKAILLAYDIKLKRDLNNTFEFLLKEIDKYFEQENKKLPFRNQLIQLNRLRNAVQHDVHEPETSSMEEWRVFTIKFLIDSFEQYFNIEFDTLSTADFISDHNIKNLLKISDNLLSNRAYLKAILLLKMVVISASYSITKTDFYPEKIYNYANSYGFDEIGEIFKEFDNKIIDIYSKIDNIQNNLAFLSKLSTGISLVDLNNFESLTPKLKFWDNAKISFYQSSTEITHKDATWVFNFVVNTFTNWQLQGLTPQMIVYREHIEEILDKINKIDINSLKM